MGTPIVVELGKQVVSKPTFTWLRFHDPGGAGVGEGGTSKTTLVLGQAATLSALSVDASMLSLDAWRLLLARHDVAGPTGDNVIRELADTIGDSLHGDVAGPTGDSVLREMAGAIGDNVHGDVAIPTGGS